MFPIHLVVLISSTIFGQSTSLNVLYNTRIERSAVSYVWDNAVIPYQFVPEFEQRDRDMFVRATKYIEQRSCVRFRPVQQGDQCSLRLVDGGCCGTHGGRQPWCEKGGHQDMTMSKGLILPYYLHELGHTLGFPHEQDRPDRDDFIYWDEDKQPSCKGGFAGKVTNLDQAAVDIFFDYVGLMADWTECYWPKYPDVPKDVPLGPGGSDDRTFSVLDFEKINAIYDCRGCFAYRFRKVSQLAAYHKPMIAGYELDGKPFYICRTYHEGHLITGKSRPDDRRCWLAFDREKEYSNTEFEVLTNPYGANFRWVTNSGQKVPSKAIKGGRTKDRETIYIARCMIEIDGRKTLVPGFVLESNPNEARVPFGSGATRCKTFEYLVCG